MSKPTHRQRDINLSGEWGTWECPNCNSEYDDPTGIVETSCDCGALVVLSAFVNENGRRDAWLSVNQR